MPLDWNTLTNTGFILGGGGSIAAFLGWLLLQDVKKKYADVDRIPQLEDRIKALETDALRHNETKDAVIRMEEQIKHLTEQVKTLTDLLITRVLKQ